MDALLVFPYFLAKLFTHLGADARFAEWIGVVLSCMCVVSVMMAPFHRRDVFRLSMAGMSCLIIVMAAAGCVCECKDAERTSERRTMVEQRNEVPSAPRQLVDLGEA